ncbi:MAG: cell envelope integrity protein TolA [Betaproteobacteria bacterium]|nr:cell envelope integrity protein TolA [Betaproteobacteria bacterium]
MSTYNPPADKLRPPPEKGMGRALLFAALMHVMLILVIALGVHWKSHPPEAVEAELWAPTAHLAAPRPPKVTPQPVPPEVKPQPAPPPPPVTRTPPAPDNAEIALEKARRLKQQEEQHQAALLAQQQAEKRLAAKLAAEKLAREQQREQAREEKQRLAQEKIAEQRKQAELQKQQELKAEQQRKAEQQLAKLQQQARSDYMKNLMSQAGTGPSTSTGTAAVSSGPSGKYAARLATLVRQNVVFPQIDQIQGDPKVIITVTLDPNSGEVLGTSIKHSSGVPSWDQAVLRAIQRVGRFPADGNGRWYTPMEIKAGPRDEG